MQGDINQVTVLSSATPLIIFQLSVFFLPAIPLLTNFMLVLNSLHSRDMLLMNCVCCWTLSLVCVYILCIYMYIFSCLKPKKKARNKLKISSSFPVKVWQKRGLNEALKTLFCHIFTGGSLHRPWCNSKTDSNSNYQLHSHLEVEQLLPALEGQIF